MRFLVTMEVIDLDPSTPPREMGAFIENAVLPSLKLLAEWEKQGKAKGGVLAGRRGQAMIVDVDSNEALGDLLRMLPMWGASEVDVTPLESFEHRLEAGAKTVQMLKQM
jgi:muconolactone delta-isomerase